LASASRGWLRRRLNLEVRTSTCPPGTAGGHRCKNEIDDFCHE
jgi:hypothetical protein